jgi:hypothetical protein
VVGVNLCCATDYPEVPRGFPQFSQEYNGTVP